NIHVKPFGRIQISNSKGDVIEQYEFNNSDPRTNVLPGSTRKYVDEIEYSKFAGRYTISANLGYGSNGQLITAKNSFWVIPVWMLVVFIAVIIAIFVLAFVVYKKLRQTRKHRVTPRRK
nr:hypothetical protein [Patescibacteria group bacterium]